MFASARPRSFEAALRDIDSGDAAVRSSAASDLARHADDHREPVVAALTRAMGDASADVRAAAALALADAGAREATEVLDKALDDGDARVRQHALAALGELGDERLLARVARALDASDAPERFQAVMAHTRLCRDHERAVDVLLDAMGDDDALVVHIALRMAEELGPGESEHGPVDARIVERAAAMLEHPETVVKVAAAVVLGRAGRSDGAAILIAVAKREVVTSEADDEAEAIELCGLLGLDGSVDALMLRAFGGLLTTDPFAWQARVALAALKHPRGIRWVLDELRSWNRERRTLAVAAAGRAGVAEARAELVAMQGDATRATPEAVEQALRALDGR
jgi:HEAT repeat protein